MFYSHDLLRKNDGKFAAIWLASVYGKNIRKILTRNQITRVDISQVCNDVVHPTVRFSLRLQSNLMLGILRVYKEQVYHFCDDLKRAWRELRMTFHVDMRMIDLQRTSLSEDACTLPDPIPELPRSPTFDDFPKDIFLMSPADLFPKDDDLDQFFDPSLRTPSPRAALTPSPQVSPGLHQKSKEDITFKDDVRPDHDEPIVVPGEDISPVLPLGEDDMFDEQERTVPPAEIEEDHGDVQIIDPESGNLITAPDTGRKEDERRFPEDMETPNARIEPVVPGRPRKRKRRAVDNIRKLTDEKIKRNHLSVSDTLRDQIIDVPLPMSAQELLNNPSLPALRSRPFIDMWRRNAVSRIIPDEEMRGDLLKAKETSSIEREEVLATSQQTETSYEASRRSSMLDGLTETPSSPTPGREQRRPEASRPGSSDEFIFQQPSFDLPPIQEIDDADHPISPIAELDHEDEEETREHVTQRRLREALGDEDETSFSDVFPPRPSGTTRITAARGLFQLLAWHQESVVVLSQPEGGFSEIYIERGSQF